MKAFIFHSPVTPRDADSDIDIEKMPLDKANVSQLQ